MQVWADLSRNEFQKTFKKYAYRKQVVFDITICKTNSKTESLTQSNNVI